jgi:hypothetical protein
MLDPRMKRQEARDAKHREEPLEEPNRDVSEVVSSRHTVELF